MQRFRLLPTRKIVNPFPMMVRNERSQPRIQNQVSMLTVKGSSFSQGQEEGGGGVFRNFRVAMCRWNTGTPSLYFWVSWILLLYQTKLPKSLPIPFLAAWELFSIKRHNISHLTVPPAGARLPFSLSSFITNFKGSAETSFRSFQWGE